MSLEVLPVVSLKDIIIFPTVVAPLFIVRKNSLNALKKASETDHRVLLVAQKNDEEVVSSEDLYTIGCLADVLQILELRDGSSKILVSSKSVVRIGRFFSTEEDYIAAEFEVCFENQKASFSEEEIAFGRIILEKFEIYSQINTRMSPDVFINIQGIVDLSKQSYQLASYLQILIHHRQSILEAPTLTRRLEIILEFLIREIQYVATEREIRERLQGEVEKNQREYYILEQIKVLKKEIGQGKEDHVEILKKKALSVKFPPHARERFEKEVDRLTYMSSSSSEYSVLQGYIEFLLDLPWEYKSKLNYNLQKAEKILQKDHFGLQDIKDRIIEYLAVFKRTHNLKAPILCFYGPPGVGKTSLARSIAKAMGRKFERISLGGVRDENEILGHRRTYVASMPGAILQGIKRAQTSNPVILLDEIDKIAQGWRGDVASAMLGVLDPEQNKYFKDHYLDLEYDLSDVVFIGTANTLDLPKPLLDRMEIIRLKSYLEEEKITIAQNYIIPRQRKMHGLQIKEWGMSNKALLHVIRCYTRESGLRNLERELAKIIRKSLVILLKKKKKDSLYVTRKMIEKYSGPSRYSERKILTEAARGIVAGLAWTETGGDLLYIESVLYAGKGRVHFTGRLGDVMKESVQLAYAYIKSQAETLGIEGDLLKNFDVHVHFPEGAIPKDGPSAGIGIFVSLVSTFLGYKVRKEVAMTGEISLLGLLLPIGGVREKLLAASRCGIKCVILPQENEKSLKDIPKNIYQHMEIRFFSKILDVLAVVFEK